MSVKRKSSTSAFILRLLAVIAFFIFFAFYSCRLNILQTSCQDFSWLPLFIFFLILALSLLALYLILMKEVNNLLSGYSETLAEINKLKDSEE